MADSATAKKMARPGASFARRYGLAFVSVTGALLLELLFHHFNLPHPFAAFALTAIAATFWYAGTKPGIVAVLPSSLIPGFMRTAKSKNTRLYRARERLLVAPSTMMFELSPDAVIPIGCHWTRS